MTELSYFHNNSDVKPISMGIKLGWMTLLGPMARGPLVHISIPNSWVGPTELVGVGPLKETDAQTPQVRLEDMGSREYH
jgi:hypothetical protein